MIRADVARLALTAGPLAAACAIAFVRRPGARVLSGVLVSVVWSLWSVLAVNVAAVQLGWWSFDPELPAFMGVAVEPWIGWAVLWGVVAPLGAWDRPLPVLVLAAAWADLLAMPLLEPWLVLGDAWVAGEALALAAAFVPGMLLARWTVRREHLRGRAALQVVAAGALLLWLVPSAAVGRSGGWSEALDLPGWGLSAGLQLLLLPAALGVRAVIELVEAGRGTPVPYDPPERLVRSGPYAYLANPMQTSVVLLLLGGAALLGTAALAGAAAIAFAYGAGLADWHEDVHLEGRFGRAWEVYRVNVRAWVPRLRPAGFEEATLLVAYSCDACSSVGRWFLARDPVALTVAPAEDSRDPELRRVTYVTADGRRYRGVAAIARALEHVHLGWAVVGWVLALPGVVHLAQLLADVCGQGPQDVSDRPFRPDACAVTSRTGRTG